jgi:hypothetical protein
MPGTARLPTLRGPHVSHREVLRYDLTSRHPSRLCHLDVDEWRQYPTLERAHGRPYFWDYCSPRAAYVGFKTCAESYAISFVPPLTRAAFLFGHYFVYVAPFPIFSRLKRLYDRMVGGVEVLGRVLVLGIVAAAHVPASEAQAQMHPRVPGL